MIFSARDDGSEYPGTSQDALRESAVERDRTQPLMNMIGDQQVVGVHHHHVTVSGDIELWQLVESYV